MSERNPVLAALRGVSNTRAFTGDPVPEAAVLALLEAARWTGSAVNVQPWHLVVVQGPETIRRIAATSDHIGWMASAPLLVVVAMANEHPEWDAYDEGRLTERVMVAAEALGLGAGMGWIPAGRGREEAQQIVGAPAGSLVRTVIAVGTPAPRDGKRQGARKPLAEIASRERHGAGGFA